MLKIPPRHDQHSTNTTIPKTSRTHGRPVSGPAIAIPKYFLFFIKRGLQQPNHDISLSYRNEQSTTQGNHIMPAIIDHVVVDTVTYNNPVVIERVSTQVKRPIIKKGHVIGYKTTTKTTNTVVPAAETTTTRTVSSVSTVSDRVSNHDLDRVSEDENYRHTQRTLKIIRKATLMDTIMDEE